MIDSMMVSTVWMGDQRSLACSYPFGSFPGACRMEMHTRPSGYTAPGAARGDSASSHGSCDARGSRCPLSTGARPSGGPSSHGTGIGDGITLPAFAHTLASRAAGTSARRNKWWASARTVGVPDVGGEAHGGRVVRVVGRKRHDGVEEPSLTAPSPPHRSAYISWTVAAAVLYHPWAPLARPQGEPPVERDDERRTEGE